MKLKIKIKEKRENIQDPFIWKYYTHTGADIIKVIWRILYKENGFYYRSKTDNLDEPEPYKYLPNHIDWKEVKDLDLINRFRKKQGLKPEKFIY